MGAPQIDLLAFLPGETLLELLQRQEPARGWIADAGTGEPVAPYDETLPSPWAIKLRPLFSSAQFLAWADARTAATRPTGLPPAWPGVANVTFGTPAALVDQLVVPGPMDGIVVSVTTPPTRTGLRMIGGMPMDYGVGELSFTTDNGDAEPWQYLGFRSGVWMPKTMNSAASAIFRVLAGAGGWATPFTRT